MPHSSSGAGLNPLFVAVVVVVGGATGQGMEIGTEKERRPAQAVVLHFLW